LTILFPLLPSARFAVWVSVWVKPEKPTQKLRRSNQRLQKTAICMEAASKIEPQSICLRAAIAQDLTG